MSVKLKLLACMLAVMMMFSIVTGAAEQTGLDYDLTIENLIMNEMTGLVTVKGTVNSDIESVVTMIVYYPDENGDAVNPNTLTTIDKNTVFIIDEKTVGENGAFEFNFTINEDRKPGNYLIKLGVKGMKFEESARRGTVTLMSPEQKGAIKSSFNAATIHSDLKAFFENYEGLFTLPIFYDSTYDSAEEDFNKIQIDYRNSYYKNGVSLVADIQSVIDTSEVICKLKTLTREELEGFLKDNEKILNIDSENTEYKSNKENVLDSVFSVINTEKLVESWGKLSSEFEKTVILGAFSNTDRAQTDYLLKKYSTAIGIDVDGEYKNVDPIEMGKAFEDKTFENLNLIKSTFETRLAQLIKTKDSDKGHGGGGGGGAGSDREYKVEGLADETVVKEEAKSSDFTDIANVKWANEAIIALKNRGIIAGMTPTQFCPDNAVTREQFVKMAVEAFGKAWNEGENNFSDVDKSAWYTPYIKRAVNAGVINGQGELFGVGQSITRQDVAVILYRIMKDKISPSKTPAFKDYDKISSYAQNAVCAMYSSNILSGDDKGFFNPTNACTRAEAAKLIYGALNIMEKGE